MAADVVIASNRGPISFRRLDDGSVASSRGGGGLVSGMAGLGSDGNVLWVCAALSGTDRDVAGAAPDHRIDRAGYDTGGPVAMLPIDPDTVDRAYNTIANTTLWYLHHGLDHPQPIVYDEAWRADWAAYLRYNDAFAAAIADAASVDARVLVQDYHLTVLPAMLRRRRPDLRISHFSHTPWASPQVFSTLPADVAGELLTGMLGADSLGFHSPRWAREFIDCCVEVLQARDLQDAVGYGGHVTQVRVHPLGVDPTPLRERASQDDVANRRRGLVTELAGLRAIVRVDRTEPSKNIARGLEAVRDLLVRYPEHRGTVVHLALEYPSRQDIEDYRLYTEQIQALAAEINRDLATPGWTPIRLEIRNDYPSSLATLAIADVVLINPVRDGMNLVAKEAALLTDDAVLVLSQEAGAADQMAESALLVDPYDVTATADALHAALVMSAEERARRHAGLVDAAVTLQPKEWLREQLDALG
jgi:trehalose 6-phosphate synthase